MPGFAVNSGICLSGLRLYIGPERGLSRMNPIYPVLCHISGRAQNARVIAQFSGDDLHVFLDA